MINDERLKKIKDAHQKYVDWWLPIDLACNSCMAAMSCNRFCETLLTYNDVWWDRWIGDVIPVDKKIHFKRIILHFIIFHHKGLIDLNNNEKVESYE